MCCGSTVSLNITNVDNHEICEGPDAILIALESLIFSSKAVIGRLSKKDSVMFASLM
jgi:hypothetical protein